MTRANTIRRRAGELAERAARRNDAEFVSSEFVKEGSDWILRVFIDRDEGVTLDDCASVSRELSTLLDVEDLVPHSYRLEVSSPGVDRPLQDPTDYERFVGERVRIRTYGPVRGRREFCGTLAGLENGDAVVQEPGGQVFEIPLEKVAKAHLEPEL